MHLDGDSALFGGLPRRLTMLRVGTLVSALAANLLCVTPMQSGLLGAAGLAALAASGVTRRRLAVLIVGLGYAALLGVIPGIVSGQPTAYVLVGTRAATGLIWVLWFGGTTQWPQLKAALRRWGAPESVTELIDHAVAHGLILVDEWQRRWQAAMLRLGLIRGAPHLESYSLVLAGGMAHAFERAVRHEDARLLRAARRHAGTAHAAAAAVLRGVAVAYPDGTGGLRDVTFTVHVGEWVAVMGPSGSGKSTLLGVLSGLLPPAGGEVTRLGEVLAPGPVARRVAAQVALVCQEPNDQLLGSTPIEDLVWGLRRHGVGEAEACTRALEMLEALGVRALAQRPIHRLSFGERKRVALAAALACEPELLLLDEPTSGLDPLAARAFTQALERNARSKRATVVWATHDAAVLPDRVQRVLLLRAGRLTFDGPREDALAPAQLAAAGLHEPVSQPVEEAPC